MKAELGTGAPPEKPSPALEQGKEAGQ